MDRNRVGALNLILAARDALKADGFLFTALFYDLSTVSLTEHMETYFGVPTETLPILCGMRCVGYDGPFGDGTIPKLSSLIHELSFGPGSRYRSVVWQKVDWMPTNIPRLDCFLIEALVAQAVKCLRPQGADILPSNAVGACRGLQAFVSQVAEDDESWKSPDFWLKYCHLLKQNDVMGNDLWELQTMMLMHGFHIHLMVTEKDCPICRGVEILDFIGSFKIRVDIGADWSGGGKKLSPLYTIFVYTDVSLDYMVSVGPTVDENLLPPDVHRIRCLKGESGEDYSEFRFFFPKHLAGPKFMFLVCHVNYCESGFGVKGMKYSTQNIRCKTGFMSEACTASRK